MNKSRKVFAVILVLVLALLSIESVFAQDKQMTNKEKLNRFQLLTNCKPIGLVVENLSQFATGIGLTKRDIIAEARSRMRFARIYTAEVKNSYLYVNVTVTKVAYSIKVELKKMVLDLFSGHNSFAGTWLTGFTGTHGGSSEYILSILTKQMNEFILELLRANDEACEQK